MKRLIYSLADLPSWTAGVSSVVDRVRDQLNLPFTFFGGGGQFSSPFFTIGRHFRLSEIDICNHLTVYLLMSVVTGLPYKV